MSLRNRKQAAGTIPDLNGLWPSLILLTSLGRSRVAGARWDRRIYARAELTGPAHAAEKPTEMRRDADKENSYGFQWQAIRRQQILGMAPRTQVNQKQHPDHHRGYAPEHQMHQQNSFKLLPF